MKTTEELEKEIEALRDALTHLIVYLVVELGQKNVTNLLNKIEKK